MAISHGFSKPCDRFKTVKTVDALVLREPRDLVTRESRRAATTAALGDDQGRALHGDGDAALALLLALGRGDREQREGSAPGHTMELPQAWSGRRRRRLLEVRHRALGGRVDGRAVDQPLLDAERYIERRIARAAVAATLPFAVDRPTRLPNGAGGSGWRKQQSEQQELFHRLPNSRSMSASLSST